MGDEAESGSSSESSWSVDSITTFSSSSSSIRMNRGEQVELHELRLLRSVVRSIYMDSADDEDESEPEDSADADVPAEGGLCPFIPPLVNTSQLDTVEEDEENSSSRESSPIRVSLVAEQYRSELACSYQAQLIQELSSAEDYNLAGLWPEDDREHAVERVNKFFKCYIMRFSFKNFFNF